MNSCITGFIQYKPTDIITSKLNKSKAPLNIKVWSPEELFLEDSWTNAWKFIFQFITRPNYKKRKKIEALTEKLTGSSYLFKISRKFLA